MDSDPRLSYVLLLVFEATPETVRSLTGKERSDPRDCPMPYR